MERGLSRQPCLLGLPLLNHVWPVLKPPPPQPPYLAVGVVIQLLSRVQLFETPWPAACQASLSFTITQSLLKLMFIESEMPSNHLVLCRPLLLCPQSFPGSFQ